jgi:acyl-CoA synthetase (AMP-forming)/AMP-acid ligase II
VQEDRQGVARATVTFHSGQSLLDLVESRAAAAPENPALLAPGRPALDYRGLADQIRRVADALAGLGIGRGDVVAVSVPDGPELAVAILGAACAASAAPLHPAATSFEIEHLLDDLHPAAAIVVEDGDHPLRRAAAERGLPTLALNPGERAGEVAVSAPAAAERDGPHASDVAVILHTSGTTARPKQVPLTHEVLVGAAARVVDSLGLTPQDRCLEVMPLIHSHGLIGGLLSSLRAGGSVVCTTTFDPREALDLACETRATWTTASPAVYRSLLETGGPEPSFRLMRSASAPMAPDLAASLEDRFEAPLIEVYGLTEAYQVAANPLPPGERRFGTVGRPTGTEVAVVDAAGNFLGTGERGEIVLRGPGVFEGYRAPQAVNDLAFLRGWFRTGDAGVLDGDGYLTIAGRLREVINRGGEKIAPREVEEALGHHPAIREVVCFPVPDPRLGEEVGALVVPAADAVLHPRQLRRFAASRLAPTKVPRWFWLRDKIPLGGTGKLNRLTLAERLKLAPASGRREALPPASLPAAAVGSADVRAELRSIWMEILALDEPPRDADHFFDLGGSSLGLVELMVAPPDRGEARRIRREHRPDPDDGDPPPLLPGLPRRGIRAALLPSGPSLGAGAALLRSRDRAASPRTAHRT